MNFNPHSKGTLVFLERTIEPLENVKKEVVVVHSESLDQLILAPPEAANGRSCGCAQKRRRSGYGRVVSLILSCRDLPVSHVSDVDFAALTGNLVNQAISLFRINR